MYVTGELYITYKCKPTTYHLMHTTFSDINWAHILQNIYICKQAQNTSNIYKNI